MNTYDKKLFENTVHNMEEVILKPYKNNDISLMHYEPALKLAIHTILCCLTESQGTYIILKILKIRMRKIRNHLSTLTHDRGKHEHE